jgi:protein phosphatase PTC7
MRLLTDVLEIVGSEHTHTHDAWSHSRDNLVLADGVGGWQERGVDPALWSHVVVWEISSALQQDYDPTESVRTGLARCRMVGSSTISIVKISGHTIHTYHIGDSPWFLIRKGRIVARSQEVLRPGSTTPRQLGRNADGNLHGPDIPSDGLSEVHEIQLGDLIVMTSDGIFDLIDITTLVETLDSDYEPAVGMTVLETILSTIRESNSYDDITVLSARVIA